ncbi:hypothetical protein KC19_5G096000 [Ceratodon purpureus]|uniref:Uncharacterized protein n=1 Tax=Ceratodon purpureus TaxID=3225 RepID=A0A8T0I1D9_CERPU|nr:hypothetical protein KC19_5G096000 [Ceratodon purpureus]
MLMGLQLALGARTTQVGRGVAVGGGRRRGRSAGRSSQHKSTGTCEGGGSRQGEGGRERDGSDLGDRLAHVEGSSGTRHECERLLGCGEFGSVLCNSSPDEILAWW